MDFSSCYACGVSWPLVSNISEQTDAIYQAED